MKEIRQILDDVVEGKLPIEVAEEKILAAYRKSNPLFSTSEKAQQFFETLKKNMPMEELSKWQKMYSKQLNQVEKIQTNIKKNVVPIFLQSNPTSLAAKFSLIRWFHLSKDSKVESNDILASQMFHVSFENHSEVRSNTFKASQLNDVHLIASDMLETSVILSKTNNFSIKNSKFERNKISKSIISDVSIDDSDFNLNSLKSTSLTNVNIKGSRLFDLNLQETSFDACEFESVELQNIVFKNCEFKNCSFKHFSLDTKERRTISGLSVSDKVFDKIGTFSEFLAKLQGEELPASPANTHKVSHKKEVEEKKDEKIELGSTKIKPAHLKKKENSDHATMR